MAAPPIGLQLELKGEVTVQRLEEALQAWSELLREIGRSVAGVISRDAVRYVITKARAGSMTLAAKPQPAMRGVSPAVMPRIGKTLTAGIHSLERQAKRPKHFNETALLKLRDLGRLVSPETPTVAIGNGNGSLVAISPRVLAHVEAVLAPEVLSIGTLEGQLEGLIIHGKGRFLIYDALTDRQVTCYFGGNVRWQDVYHAFGKRVGVTGMIRSRRSGEQASIDVKQIHVFEAEESLPSAADVLGILKTAQ